MRFWLALSVLSAVLAGGAAAFYLSESRRASGRVVHLEQRVRELESGLAGAHEQRAEFSQFVEEKIEEIHTWREERARQARESFRPMPEGVRLALAALNRLLVEDGFAGMRFLSATELRGRELVDVELLERDEETLQRQLYLAERMTMELDREKGELTIRLFDGVRHAPEGAVDLPPDGWPLALADVHGPKWESRLGYLLEANGEYPGEEIDAAAVELDGYTRELWLDRLDRLLGQADLDLLYRVEKFSGLSGGVFTDVLLVGYRDRILHLAVEAERMSVVVDRAAETVELKLHGGLLRRAAGTSTIGPEGYRVLLPSVTIEQATDVMMGMVVQ